MVGQRRIRPHALFGKRNTHERIHETGKLREPTLKFNNFFFSKFCAYLQADQTCLKSVKPIKADNVHSGRGISKFTRFNIIW